MTESTTTPNLLDRIAAGTERTHTTEDGRHTIRMARDYDFPIADVWSAWTDPQRLARWLGMPRGDLSLDGYVDLAMDPPDGDVTSLRILACEAPRLLEVSWQPAWDTEEPESRVRLELTDLDGRTHLLLTHARLTEDGAVGYGAGWEEFLVLLEGQLAREAGRDDAGYDRKSLERGLRPYWERVVRG